MKLAIYPFAIAALTSSARADVAVDWAKGLVTANGVGIADRHAPNPAVARGTSRRGAEDAARKKLADEVAVYDHALPPERIALHYLIGTQGPQPLP